MKAGQGSLKVQALLSWAFAPALHAHLACRTVQAAINGVHGMFSCRDISWGPQQDSCLCACFDRSRQQQHAPCRRSSCKYTHLQDPETYQRRVAGCHFIKPKVVVLTPSEKVPNVAKVPNGSCVSKGVGSDARALQQ